MARRATKKTAANAGANEEVEEAVGDGTSLKEMVLGYSPEFEQEVTVTVGGQQQAVNEKHVLTEGSAEELCELLTAAGYKCELVRDQDGAIIGHPITLDSITKDSDGNYILDNSKGGAASSASAPHLVFENGTIVNAGHLAEPFRRYHMNEGDLYSIALKTALVTIENEAQRQGKAEQDETKLRKITGAI